MSEAGLDDAGVFLKMTTRLQEIHSDYTNYIQTFPSN